MKLHKISILNNRGLTLIEILVVLGVFGLVVSLGASFGLGSYQAYLFHTEHGNITKLLTKARNEAANNFDQSAHGVYIDTDTYTIFVGNNYSATDPNNITFERSGAIQISGASEIVFEQLSGNLQSCDVSPNPCQITFSFETRSRTVTINEVGGITW